MTDTKPMHSPLPWTLVPVPDSFYDNSSEVRAANGDTVCDNTRFYPTEVSPENQALIVEAVNSHARLTAERAELVRMLSIITLNAVLQPDASIGGATDTYAVPLDDIEAARALLSRLGG